MIANMCDMLVQIWICSSSSEKYKERLCSLHLTPTNALHLSPLAIRFIVSESITQMIKINIYSAKWLQSEKLFQ